MITALYFKCSDGSRFKLELNYDDYAPHFGVITAHDAEHEDNDTPISFKRFDVQGRHSWRGKYIALAKVLKDCRIYDRGIDHVQVICRIGSLEKIFISRAGSWSSYLPHRQLRNFSN